MPDFDRSEDTGTNGQGSVDTNGFILNVFPDAPDVRDWIYRPALIGIRNYVTPDIDQLNVRNQLQEGACTGFALAAAIDLLNRRRERGEVTVSARMLYKMAQHFDEWTGEDYDGSSMRGAIRGWWHNGVCTEDVWPYENAEHSEDLTLARAKEARSNTIGAYYRLSPNVSDYHCALNETGVLVVSARVHRGWFSPLDSDGCIIKGEAIPGAGHAFAIVGYNSNGFYVQNSWGKGWGNNGTCIWTYEDWAENIMDGWVFRLALPEPKIFGLNAGVDSQASIDKDEWPGWFKKSTKRSEIAGHFVHIDDGKFHEKGKYHSNENDVRETVQQIKNSSRGYQHIVFYAHGGLNPPKSSAARVKGMKDVFKANGIYPYHFMYDSGLLEELSDVITGRSDRAETRIGSFFDSTDKIIEESVSKIGTLLWEEIKQGTEQAFKAAGAGTSVLKIFAEAVTAKNLKVHLIGHSAGAILMAHLLNATDNLGYGIETCSLLAPACTVDLYNSHFAPRSRSGSSNNDTKVKNIRIYSLTDQLERDDNVAKLYRKSLLYLISNAFERSDPLKSTPIAGMAKFEAEITPGGNLDFIYSGVGSPVRNNSKSHGGFDNDEDTMNDILHNILGKQPRPSFTKNDLNF